MQRQQRSKSRPKQQLIYKRKDEITAEKVEGGAAEHVEGEGEPKRRDNDRRKGNNAGKSQGGYRAKGTEVEGEEFKVPVFTSAYEEYNAGYWRRERMEKIKVKEDTVLPAMPKPILEAPDEAIYHKSRADIDEKIAAMNIRLVRTMSLLYREFINLNHSFTHQVYYL